MIRIGRFDCLCMPGNTAAAAEAAGICYQSGSCGPDDRQEMGLAPEHRGHKRD